MEEMEELGSPYVVLSTKDNVLLPIGEANYMYKLVFGVVEDFWMKNSKTC